MEVRRHRDARGEGKQEASIQNALPEVRVRRLKFETYEPDAHRQAEPDEIPRQSILRAVQLGRREAEVPRQATRESIGAPEFRA